MCLPFPYNSLKKMYESDQSALGALSFWHNALHQAEAPTLTHSDALPLIKFHTRISKLIIAQNVAPQQHGHKDRRFRKK